MNHKENNFILNLDWNKVFIKHFLFMSLCFLLGINNIVAQNPKKEIKKFQKELNHHYKDPSKSPLKGAERKAFRKHQFYPIDLDFRFEATLIKNENPIPFDMGTSSEKVKKYIKYGDIVFQYQGKEYRLEVYQSLSLMKTEKYKTHLFLPFTDNTTGDETYGGGRYLDLEIPEGNSITLDFNQAYYPYCAYTTGYSCPIPPKANYLDMSIKAGITGIPK